MGCCGCLTYSCWLHIWRLPRCSVCWLFTHTPLGSVAAVDLLRLLAALVTRLIWTPFTFVGCLLRLLDYPLPDYGYIYDLHILVAVPCCYGCTRSAVGYAFGYDTRLVGPCPFIYVVGLRLRCGLFYYPRLRIYAFVTFTHGYVGYRLITVDLHVCRTFALPVGLPRGYVLRFGLVTVTRCTVVAPRAVARLIYPTFDYALLRCTLVGYVDCWLVAVRWLRCGYGCWLLRRHYTLGSVVAGWLHCPLVTLLAFPVGCRALPLLLLRLITLRTFGLPHALRLFGYLVDVVAPICCWVCYVAVVVGC